MKGADRQIAFPAVRRRTHAAVAVQLLLSAVVASLQTLGQSSSSSMQRHAPHGVVTEPEAISHMLGISPIFVEMQEYLNSKQTWRLPT